MTTQMINESVTERHLQARIGARRRAEHVLQRAVLLPKDERMILEEIFRHGSSMAEVAEATGLPVRTLHRRVRTMLARMDSDLFLFVARHEKIIPPAARPTARRVALHGQSLRSVARETGASLHRVREHMRAVHTLANLL
ncbi:MAG: sigma factor-like helix-turn-helix DNA-binding protein [Phycisphaeraceae bacterium]